jgi:hypothetical protein
MSVQPVSGCLFAGYGGAEQERQRRKARSDAWLAHRMDVIMQCSKLKRSMDWYLSRGYRESAEVYRQRIDRLLAEVKA